jgi:hypothetical protein
MNIKSFLQCLSVGVLTLCIGSISLQGQNVYCVGPSATGNGSGSDWADLKAWSAGPNRGDTWYLVGGTYPGETFNVAVSGSSLITITKATLQNYASITATGWQAYMATQAVFTSGMTFESGNFVFDGVNPQGTNWDETPTDYGFQFAPLLCNDIHIGPESGTSTNFTFAHVAGEGYVNAGDPSSIGCNNFAVSTTSASTEIDGVNITNCLFWHWQNDVATTATTEKNWLISGNIFWGCKYYTDAHCECFSENIGTDQNITICNNLFYNNNGVTCCIVVALIGTSPGPFYIYGNVFLNNTSDEGGTGCNGIIGTGNANAVANNVFIFNNTFDGNNGIWLNNLDASSGSVITGAATNNLFFNMGSGLAGTVPSGFGTVDYSAYYSCSGDTIADTHPQSSSGNPFVNDSSFNFELISNTVAGANLGAPYNVDAAGNVRTTWTRGAFEYTSGIIITNSPSITMDLVGTTNNTANGFSLSIGASGTAPLTYNWFFNGSQVQTGSSSTYSSVPATTNQSGNYQVIVTNLYGAATSSIVNVLITNAVTNFVPLSFSVTNSYGTIISPFTITGNYISQSSYNYGNPSAGGQALYWFYITNAGNYEILATVNCTTPDNGVNTTNDSFYLNIDSFPTDPANVWDVYPPTTGWTNVYVSWRGANAKTNDQYSPVVFSNLTVGAHELFLVGREAGAEISWLTITNYNGATQPPPSPAIQVTPGSLTFGTILVGADPTSSFLVQNVGGGTLSGTASVTAPFSIVSGGTYNLSANQSQTITVSFNPTTAGNYSQNVTLTGGGGASVGVSGSATNAPVNPAIQVSPTNIAFETILSGSSVTGSFTVQNIGGGTLSGTASVGSPFSIVSGGNYNLSSNQSQMVTVAFNPTSAGSYNQSVTLTGGGGASVGLTGSATNAPILPTVSAISMNVTDVDLNLAGLQIYAGTTVQFLATATNAQTWQWSYAVNGGSPVVYTNGTSPITNVSYYFGTNTIGNSYVWTLVVSNGLAWAESQTNLSVEAAPPPVTVITNYVPGPTNAATSGTLSGLLTYSTVINGVSTTYWYQPLPSLGNSSGGTATYNVTITNAGDYEIQALVYAPNANANTFLVNIDSPPQNPTMIWDITPLTSGFQERTVSWRGNGSAGNDQIVPTIFTLSTGQHQVIFVGNAPGTAMASFNLVQVVTTVQSPSPPAAPNGLRIVATNP